MPHPRFMRVRVLTLPSVFCRPLFHEGLDYMHKNPVGRKLVAHPKAARSWLECEKGEPGVIQVNPFFIFCEAICRSLKRPTPLSPLRPATSGLVIVLPRFYGRM